MWNFSFWLWCTTEFKQTEVKWFYQWKARFHDSSLSKASNVHSNWLFHVSNCLYVRTSCCCCCQWRQWCGVRGRRLYQLNAAHKASNYCIINGRDACTSSSSSSSSQLAQRTLKRRPLSLADVFWLALISSNRPTLCGPATTPGAYNRLFL